MADIAKQIEKLAAAANIRARVDKPVCSCSTCREAVTEAEAIMLRLMEEKCESFALAVGIIIWSRLGTLYEDSVGEDAYDKFEDKVIRRSQSLGRTKDELTAELVSARTRRYKPKGGPV